MKRNLPWTILAQAFLVALGLVIGCSEDKGKLVWQQIPVADTRFKAGITGILALPGGHAIAVGYSMPGNFRFRPVSVLYNGTQWLPLAVTGHDPPASFKLTGLENCDDGFVYASGFWRTQPDEPGSSHPVMYRLDGDTWNEVDIAEAGDLSALELDALATGPGGEIRAVGTGVDGTGFCLRRAGGHWSLMSIAPSPAWAGGSWALSCISRAPGGTWYSGGPLVGKPGGALLVDEGSGWKPSAPVSSLEESINGVAADPHGNLWAASNHAVGDKFQGTIFKITGSAASAFPVTRKTAGNFRIFGIGFSSTGRGWTVGGRDPDDPFFAGFDGQTWLESVVEVDLTPIAAPIRPASAHPQSVKEEVFGGELFDVSVQSEDIAFAAGQAEEVSGDGDHELIPRLFKVRRLLLELDRPVPKTPLRPF